MSGRPWQVTVAPDAARDLAGILDWTNSHFGAGQAARYRATILAAILSLEEGPDIPGARRAAYAGIEYFILHVARRGRHGRHILLCRAQPPSDIEILRILHDAMDPSRHLHSQIDP